MKTIVSKTSENVLNFVCSTSDSDFCGDRVYMKGIDFTVKMLNVDYTLEELKELVPTARAFPIIFEDDNYVGTLSDLKQYVSK